MKHILPLVLIMVAVGAPVAVAKQAEYLSAQFLSAQTGTTLIANQPINMALQIDLKEGWYTYWRMPGDAGLPPTFDWTGSQNVKDIQILWPAPQRFEEMGLNSFGYKESVTLPLMVLPENPGEDITLNLKSELMVCHNICIPQTLTMMRVFRGGDAVVSIQKPMIDRALETIPSEGNEQLGIDTVVLGKDGVVVTARSKNGWDGKSDIIVETKNSLLTLPPQIVAQDNDPSVTIFKVPAPQGMDLPTRLFGQSVNILLIHEDKAIEKKVAF